MIILSGFKYFKKDIRIILIFDYIFLLEFFNQNSRYDTRGADEELVFGALVHYLHVQGSSLGVPFAHKDLVLVPPRGRQAFDLLHVSKSLFGPGILNPRPFLVLRDLDDFTKRQE